MPAIDCARAILKYVDPETAVIFVAIAGAESNWRLNASGDASASSYACNGYCSWGPWQINICAHYGWLKDVVGSANPCAIRDWLIASYENSALAAVTVWQRAGNSFCPWTVYEESCSSRHNGRYRNYLAQAQAAVNEALQAQLAPPMVHGFFQCINEKTVAVSLWWNPVPNATRYEVWHADVEKLVDTQDTHFETQIYSPYWKEGAEYTLAVKACNDTACSEPAEYKIVATCGKAPAFSVVAAALLAVLFGGAGIGFIAFAHKEKLEKLWHAAGKMLFGGWLK